MKNIYCKNCGTKNNIVDKKCQNCHNLLSKENIFENVDEKELKKFLDPNLVIWLGLSFFIGISIILLEVVKDIAFFENLVFGGVGVVLAGISMKKYKKLSVLAMIINVLAMVY